MTDFKATGKNEFVDQYPYITYTDKEDDVNGDGGGSIPIASSDSVGGVMVGEGLNIADDGTLSVAGGSGDEIFIIEIGIDPQTYAWVLVTDVNDIVQARADLKIPIVVYKGTSPYNQVIVYSSSKFDYDGVHCSSFGYSRNGQQYSMYSEELLINYDTGVITSNTYDWSVTKNS